MADRKTVGNWLISQSKKSGLDLERTRTAIRAIKTVRHPLRQLRSRRYLHRLPNLGQAETMNRDKGYFLFTEDGFSERHSALDDCRKIWNLLGEGDRSNPATHDRISRSRKSHLINLLTSQELLQFQGIMNFALSDEVIEFAAKYLGFVPKLHSIQLWWSLSNTPIGSSQLFHRDELDRMQVKFFLFINEVHQGNGPLSFLPADVSDHVCRSLDRKWGRMSDEDVWKHAPRDTLIEAKGPPGTLAALDTCRCLHFGSRAMTDDRLVLMFNFAAHNAVQEVGKPLEEEVRRRYATDPVRRLVLDA